MADSNSQKNLNREQSIAKLKELIADVPVAMLTTMNSDGTIHSRPMWTQQVGFDGDLWFFTSNATPKTEELAKDNRVTVTYSNSSDHCYVAVYGRGQIVKDRQQAEKLWSPAFA